MYTFLTSTCRLEKHAFCRRVMSTKTHTEHALVSLRQQILSGTFSGGQRLYEVALAEQLKVSRTPVRAALSKLAEEGLLERLSSGGFRVRRFDLQDVVDTIELRGVLEGMAARLAAERGASREALREIRSTLAELDGVVAEEYIDMADYSRLNSSFHAQLAALSGSRVVLREIERVTALPFASPSAFVKDETRADGHRHNLITAQDQHNRIIDAIVARQGARAESLAREHAFAAHRNIEFLTKDPSALDEGPVSLALVSRQSTWGR